jgi:hypothetical protein
MESKYTAYTGLSLLFIYVFRASSKTQLDGNSYGKYYVHIGLDHILYH